MLSGLNHLTLAVRDVARSVAFYHTLLGLRRHAVWDGGAYLSCGDLWLCLSLDDGAGAPPADYTHYAFTVSEADFPRMVETLTRAASRPGKPTAAKATPGIFSTRTGISWSCTSQSRHPTGRLPRAALPGDDVF
ncbi:Fosfomycin resistance protein FosA [Cronobacter dublinensis 1210]|uniref:Fosfomycin resistance protein FosA n=1 Tax=Cronobacter dublinensis 1210 TaxID=1208656 RepID=A0ABP1WA49_9ENTR|nr:Fosfomycin resistance protein FosA [Cronobacter dublinensis 1210]